MDAENVYFAQNKLATQGHRLMFVIILALLVACTPETNNLPPTNLVQSTGVPETELDMREANVLDVSFEQIDEEKFLIEVTLVHDDDGEAPNFADLWQVEDLSGNILGIRVLLHSHGNQPFARSETITIPQAVSEVVVRGHDMIHGHGGQSMRVDLNTGVVEAFIEGVD
jgi:hypothetical protein